MRKWIPAVFIAASYVFAWFAFVRLPDQVTLGWNAFVPWGGLSGAEAMPRAVAAFAIPTVALAVWLLLRVVASPAGERLGRRVFPRWLVSARTGADAVERFRPTFDLIVALVVGLVLAFHVVTIGSALDWPSWTPRAFTTAIGLGLIVLGNIMPRTRPNWVAGLRTKRTLSDPDLWRRTHRYFGALLMVTGIAVVAVSWLAAPYALLLAAVGMLVSAVAATVFAHSSAGPGAGIHAESGHASE